MQFNLPGTPKPEIEFKPEALLKKTPKKKLFTYDPEEPLPTSVGGCDEIIVELEDRILSGEKILLSIRSIFVSHCNKIAGWKRYSESWNGNVDEEDSIEASSEDREPLSFSLSSPKKEAKLFIEKSGSKTITEETPEVLECVNSLIREGINDVELIKKKTRVSRFIIRKLLANATSK